MYIYILDALYQHPLYLHFTNQRHIYTSSYISRATKIHSRQQQGTYIYVLHVLRQQPTTFYRCLVVGCVFLWLLSYIYKPLDIIEIMSNCNTNSQRRIYTSIFQGISKTLVAEVNIEIHMLQTKSLHARGKSTL